MLESLFGRVETPPSGRVESRPQNRYSSLVIRPRKSITFAMAESSFGRVETRHQNRHCRVLIRPPETDSKNDVAKNKSPRLKSLSRAYCQKMPPSAFSAAENADGGIFWQ